jgi:uncharacterized protein
MGIISKPTLVNHDKTMDKTQQAVSVFAVCAAIILAGIIIAYKPELTPELGEFRFPTGTPPALGATNFKATAVTNTENLRTLSISGTGAIKAKADQAIVTLGAYTENKLANIAIDENAQIMTAVIKALKNTGLKDTDIQTTSYTVTPNYNWDLKMVTGYQVTNIVQVKILDLTKVGEAIDAATVAGANRVDGISFGLSEESTNTMKLAAYKAAIDDAKAKATVITSNLDISITGVQSVSESVYYPPVPYRSYTAAEGAKSSTPILDGSLSVTVTLSIVYIIG